MIDHVDTKLYLKPMLQKTCPPPMFPARFLTETRKPVPYGRETRFQLMGTVSHVGNLFP